MSFRTDFFDLAVQRTPKSLLQHHNSKASVLQCSTFFMVQLSNPYMTIGKTIALDLCRQSDVSAFEYAVRFAITFLPRSKHILFYLFFLEVWVYLVSKSIIFHDIEVTSSVSFTVAVTIHNDSGAQENKICQCLQFFPSICHQVMGLGSSPVAHRKGVYLQRRCRRHGFSPWVRQIPWKKPWQPTPVFLPGESHGLRSLLGCSPLGAKSWAWLNWLNYTHTMGCHDLRFLNVEFQASFFTLLFHLHQEAL